MIQLNVISDLAKLLLKLVFRHQVTERNPINLFPSAARAVTEVGPVDMLPPHLFVGQLFVFLAVLIFFFSEARLVAHSRHASTCQLLVLDRHSHVAVKVVVVHRVGQRALQHVSNDLANRISVTIAPADIRLRRLIKQRRADRLHVGI